MPKTPAYYLDTSAYGRDALGDPTSPYAGCAQLLVQLVRSGTCRVYGSVEVLAELAGIAHGDTAFAAPMQEFFWNLVGPRAYRIVTDIGYDELKKGARLTDKEACLDPQALAETRRKFDDPTWASTVSNRVWEGEAKVAADDKRPRYALEVATQKLEQLVPNPTKRDTQKAFSRQRTPAQFKGTVKNRVRNFLRDLRKSENIHRRIFEENFPIQNLPTVCAWLCFSVGQDLSRIARGKEKAEKGDRFDHAHYAHAAYAGCLVTMDKIIKRIAERITWKPIRVLDLNEFRAEVERIEAGGWQES